MIHDFELRQTSSTPLVLADQDQGRITMAGDSYPENPFEFFQPIIDWIENYLSQDTRPLHLELALVYLNTSSIRAMMDIFDRMEEAFQHGREVSVHWTFDPENERVGELADEFKEDCTFPFIIAPRA
jgi:hypothetical protein